MVLDEGDFGGKLALDGCFEAGESGGCCCNDEGWDGCGCGGAGGEALRSRIACAADKSSAGLHRTEGRSSSEYGR